MFSCIRELSLILVLCSFQWKCFIAVIADIFSVYFVLRTSDTHTLFFFFGHTTRHAGSQFPYQGSNLHPLQGKHRVLTTGPPGKSQAHHTLRQTFIPILQKWKPRLSMVTDLFGSHQLWHSQASNPHLSDFKTHAFNHKIKLQPMYLNTQVTLICKHNNEISICVTLHPVIDRINIG